MMAQAALVAPVRSKSFPLQEKNIWDKMEEEKLLQQTRAIKLFDKAQEEKQMAQEEQMGEEAQNQLLARVAEGEELFKQLCEQADAHEEEMKKSGQEQRKVGITQNNQYVHYVRVPHYPYSRVHCPITLTLRI